MKTRESFYVFKLSLTTYGNIGAILDSRDLAHALSLGGKNNSYDSTFLDSKEYFFCGNHLVHLSLADDDCLRLNTCKLHLKTYVV